ncbi:hypothetical protein [Carboxylicivirga taeanensis]|uniref:hypothetical protein n=1 Tax=Carboxylicivirga taeanensis TaxID=1416875 RepID=UPI003F6DF2AA
MNYIRHLNQVLESFTMDKRIIPRHISMYMALFFLWNKFKFPETIYFARGELMPLSKIGSMRYYHLTLHELDEWGYISYQPSKSMYKASCVTIIACCNSATSGETCSATSAATSGASSTGTCSATTSEAIKINTNKTVLNTINNQKTPENLSEHARDAHPAPIDNEVQATRNAAGEKRQRFQKPTLDELENYFQSREGPVEEAQRFFNHFESNGWRVGGKSPMKDWKAAARNWLLNRNKYQRIRAMGRDNPLATSNDKDYGEPL